MQGTGLIPHRRDKNDESDDDSYFCKCKEGDYMAFFGMCMPKLNGKDPLQSKVIDGILFGKENYVRFVPPAFYNGLDDYSWFLPLINEKGRRALYITPYECSFDEDRHTELLKYGGSSHDLACGCKARYKMNRMGECVPSCHKLVPPGREETKYFYCLDDYDL
ncbi:MAG: hypothetical protein MHMPM18_002072 [Marteilia pararefringens]